MCFDMVLETLFPHTRVRPVDVDAADLATRTINSLWTESKKGKTDETSLLDQKRASDLLNKTLHKLLPGYEGDALALIVPAYETLWRVVLLTYVHVAFRYLDDVTRVLVRAVIENMSESNLEAPLPVNVDNFARVLLDLMHADRSVFPRRDNFLPFEQAADHFFVGSGSPPSIPADKTHLSRLSLPQTGSGCRISSPRRAHLGLRCPEVPTKPLRHTDTEPEGCVYALWHRRKFMSGRQRFWEENYCALGRGPVQTTRDQRVGGTHIV